MTRIATTTLIAIGGLCVLAACESDGGANDGVSRFAGPVTPYYGPGSVPREQPVPEAGPLDLEAAVKG